MVRVLFFGTPQIAVPFLDWLIQHTKVTGVVCRADEPAGRGHHLQAPPTKIFAQQHGIPVLQPAGPWDGEIISAIKNFNSDVGIVVAYGRILPSAVLSAPRWGCLNLHFSLLPKYRGAAPMQWALLNGEAQTGVSAFWLDEGLDTGPIARQAEVKINPEDDISSLREKLIPVGIRILEETIAEIASGRIVREPQSGEATFAPLLKKEQGKIRWADSAEKIVNAVRALHEWPGIHTSYTSAKGPTGLKILEAAVVSGKGPGGAIATASKDGITVFAGSGAVLIKRVQPESKKPMSGWDFWQGARLNLGDHFE